MKLPVLRKQLSDAQIAMHHAFTKSCRRSILEMTTKAASGHPGGSLSSLDMLAMVYAFIISQTGNPIVVSNGHISPAVYAVLAELGYIPKDEVIDTFRSAGSIYEGHVSREVPGIWYGTGPLGTGVSAATGIAYAYKKKRSKLDVFAFIGDGEAQEGQVYEMMHSAVKEQLSNLLVFMDFNAVQLSGSLSSVMKYDPVKTFEAAGWKVYVINGHNPQEIWHTIARSKTEKKRPRIIIGKTVMGKGVSFMEKEGKTRKSTWHGKAPTSQETEKELASLILSKREQSAIDFIVSEKKWKPKNNNIALLKKTPRMVYKKEMDCRSAYGNALAEIAVANPSVIGITADLAESVRMTELSKRRPKQFLDVGIAEQHMISMSGGMSVAGLVPVCSTFAAFMTSRAKDQARVNDINQTNVKMVATHAGLSVGEDGPTHQAIDDSGSVLGFFNTMHLEPADANHADVLTHFAIQTHGNVYMRMGRHKLPILTNSKGTPFYNKAYKYSYGKCDLLRTGRDITIVAIGSVAHYAVEAHELLMKSGIKAEIIVASSIKAFDDTLKNSIKKTGRVLTVEDHNPYSGLGSQVQMFANNEGISATINTLGVSEYMRSGTANDLYMITGLDAEGIASKAKELFA